MQRIVIFGNSGSGKSTLAKCLSDKYKLAHLDLDVLAWDNNVPPTRRLIVDSKKEIDNFLDKNRSGVVEGCYADLLRLIIDKASKIIFLNPGDNVCVENCRKRPWEPHKYKTPEEQDKNLEMLIGWIKQYSCRNDELSLIAHRGLFDNFNGCKIEYTSNNVQELL